MKKPFFLILFPVLWFCLSSGATVRTLWSGNKAFASWSDCQDIAATALAAVKPESLLQLDISARSGAQLQISYGSSWTNLPGLGALGISGNFELLVTAELAPKLKQGIHIKGVNYTLTAVRLVTPDQAYTTHNVSWFPWELLFASGGEKGPTCLLNVKKKGGAGWYYADGIDLSTYGNVHITFSQATRAALTFQILYGNDKVAQATVEAGTTEFNYPLNSRLKGVYSINLVTDEAQSVFLGSVDVMDNEGHYVSGIKAVRNTAAGRVVKTEYFTVDGKVAPTRTPDITIVRQTLENGQTVTRKIK